MISGVSKVSDDLPVTCKCNRSSPEFLINSQHCWELVCCQADSEKSSCHIIDLVFLINPGHLAQNEVLRLYIFFLKKTDVGDVALGPHTRRCAASTSLWQKELNFRAKPCIILGHQQKAATMSVHARRQSDRHIKRYSKILKWRTIRQREALRNLLLSLQQHLCKSHQRGPVLGAITDTLPFHFHSTPVFIAPTQGLPPTNPNTITGQLLTAKQCF